MGSRETQEHRILGEDVVRFFTNTFRSPEDVKFCKNNENIALATRIKRRLWDGVGGWAPRGSLFPALHLDSFVSLGSWADGFTVLLPLLSQVFNYIVVFDPPPSVWLEDDNITADCEVCSTRGVTRTYPHRDYIQGLKWTWRSDFSLQRPDR